MNHCGLATPRPRSTAAKAPVVGSNMNTQMRPTPTPDSTNGENTAARARPAPRTFLFKASAMSRPNTIDPPTVATVKIAVTLRMSRLPGVVKNET